MYRTKTNIDKSTFTNLLQKKRNDQLAFFYRAFFMYLNIIVMKMKKQLNLDLKSLLFLVNLYFHFEFIINSIFSNFEKTHLIFKSNQSIPTKTYPPTILNFMKKTQMRLKNDEFAKIYVNLFVSDCICTGGPHLQLRPD